MHGPLALVGGDEFHPGNERQDEILRDACGGRPAFVVATAAQDFASGAVESARRWFAGLGLEVHELRIRDKDDACSPEIVEAAAGAGLVYIAGGDPGWVVEVLRASPVWTAIAAAWRSGAALAGSSAGAMALCEWCLVQTSWPGEVDERSVDALGLVRAARSSPTSTCSATHGFHGHRRASARRPRSSVSTSAPPRCCAKAAGRCSARARDDPARAAAPRHIEGEKIDGMSNPEP